MRNHVLRQRLAHYAEYLLVRALICVFQALSLNTCHALSRGLGWFLHRVVKLRGKVVTENL